MTEGKGSGFDEFGPGLGLRGGEAVLVETLQMQGLWLRGSAWRPRLWWHRWLHSRAGPARRRRSCWATFRIRRCIAIPASSPKLRLLQDAVPRPRGRNWVRTTPHPRIESGAGSALSPRRGKKTKTPHPTLSPRRGIKTAKTVGEGLPGRVGCSGVWFDTARRRLWAGSPRTVGRGAPKARSLGGPRDDRGDAGRDLDRKTPHPTLSPRRGIRLASGLGAASRGAGCWGGL